MSRPRTAAAAPRTGPRRTAAWRTVTATQPQASARERARAPAIGQQAARQHDERVAGRNALNTRPIWAWVSPYSSITSAPATEMFTRQRYAAVAVAASSSTSPSAGAGSRWSGTRAAATRVRGRAARAGAAVRLVQIEHDDLVDAGLEPRRGAVEALLRADVPVAAEVVPVHPDHALPVAGHVDERVGGRVEGERPRKNVPGPRRRSAAGRAAPSPTRRRAAAGTPPSSSASCPSSVTRSVMPLRSIISCAKLMWPMPSTRMSSTGIGVVGPRQIDRLLAQPPVERADELAVHEHVGVVVQIGDDQLARTSGPPASSGRARAPGSGRTPRTASAARTRSAAGRWFQSDACGRIANSGTAIAGIGSGIGGSDWPAGRCDAMRSRSAWYFGVGAALLVDRRVVVVAGDVGLVALAAGVGAGREAEVRAAVRDVEVERLPVGRAGT